MLDGLTGLRERGFEPATIVDIGAYEGGCGLSPMFIQQYESHTINFTRLRSKDCKLSARRERWWQLQLERSYHKAKLEQANLADANSCASNVGQYCPIFSISSSCRI
jgi:hypothetical protein